MELFRGFIHDDDEHQGESNKNSQTHHHSHHHHHHSHSNHLHHDQTGEFEGFNKTITCAEICEPYDDNPNCLAEPTINTGLSNFNPEEFLHTDLESPVPKYHKE